MKNTTSFLTILMKKIHKILWFVILIIIFFLLFGCYKNDNNNDNNNCLNDTDFENIFENKILLSDPDLKSASSVQLSYDEYNIYFVYLASYENYGESRDLIMLSIYNFTTEELKHFPIVKDGDVIDNMIIKRPFEPNILKLSNNLYIYFYSNYQYYCKKFLLDSYEMDNAISELYINYNDYFYLFNNSNINEIYTENDKVFGSYCIFTSNFIYYNNMYYGVISSFYGCGLIVSSTDGFNWYFENFTPGKCQFEEQLCVSNDFFYCIGRTDSVIYYSRDLLNWQSYLSVNPFSSRPQLINYDEHLLSIIPNKEDMEGSIGAKGRNIIDLYYDDTYLFRLKYKFGIVYPRVFIIGNHFYMLFSSGDRYYSYNTESKDAIYMIDFFM